MRANDVVVEPADQRTGLGTGKERNGHLLDVLENTGAKVVDKALANDRRYPTFEKSEDGVKDGQSGGDEGEPDNQTFVVNAGLFVNDDVNDLAK